MKSKVLKIGTVLLTCVCLISFVSLPVSAVVSGGSTLLVLDSSTLYTPGIVGSQVNATVSNSNSFFNAQFGASYTGKQEVALRFTFTADNNHGYFKLLIKSYDNLLSSSYQGIFDSNGNRISFLNYSHTSQGVLITGTGTIPSNFYIVTYYNYSSTGVHTVYLGDFVFEPSNEADRIISNQDKNTQSIIDAQQQATQDQTDAIMNDWDGGVDVDDGTTDNFKNAEDAALGGKTYSQIQEEINNAIDFDINIFDSAKIGKMHSLFDNVLSACGSSYQALFMLCLTLGLAAFLIGRRYG